eukprot:scaffold186858_cov19-Tisochrysis_lutea.AAC.1
MEATVAGQDAGTDERGGMCCTENAGCKRACQRKLAHVRSHVHTHTLTSIAQSQLVQSPTAVQLKRNDYKSETIKKLQWISCVIVWMLCARSRQVQLKHNKRKSEAIKKLLAAEAGGEAEGGSACALPARQGKGLRFACGARQAQTKL